MIDFTGKVVTVYLTSQDDPTDQLIISELVGTGSDDPQDDWTGITHSDTEDYVTIKISTSDTALLAEATTYLVTLVIDDYEIDKGFVTTKNLGEE